MARPDERPSDESRPGPTVRAVSLRAVLLDVDGTLLDSNDAHAQSWVDTFAELGYDVPFDRVRPLIGKGGDKLLPETVGVEKDSQEGKRLSARRSAMFKERYLPTLRPFPGARALLERVRAEGLELIVATSAQENELRGLLTQAGVADLIELKTSSSDASSSKPDPDIIRAALERGERDPSECMMVGDTPYDVEAAGRAGVPTVALRCGGWWSDDDLRGAVAIYDGPAELLARYDESPLASRVPERG